MLLAIAACANAFLWREGALRAIALLLFQAVSLLLALMGGFSYWWDSGMRPGQKSAVVRVSGLVMFIVSLLAMLRSGSKDDWP